MRVTVGIKALNEEKNIERAIKSALQAVDQCQGHVVLADSGSTDDTIEIASRYNIDIVQLTNSAERSCGAGAQLGYQFARGEFFYLMDGDMVLHSEFLLAAVSFLELNAEYAGVGGLLNEMNVTGESYRILKEKLQSDRNWNAGPVDHLDGGGLYRTAAIREIGYFADKNLHSFEEFDLAARLSSAGWRLARIDQYAVDHFGHTTGGYKLLLRRLRSGYAAGCGQVLRRSVRRPHFATVVKKLKHIRVSIAVIVWWCVLATSVLLPVTVGAKLTATLCLLLAPLVFLAIRRRSASLGLYSIFAWNITAVGFISGLLFSRNSKEFTVAASVLRSMK
jgi:glycosyltransferase involved in cell wall biosynthesis